eukprot:scaffold247694_cov48-Prasinocladus_malaysianus.AAC.2
MSVVTGGVVRRGRRRWPVGLAAGALAFPAQLPRAQGGCRPFSPSRPVGWRNSYRPRLCHIYTAEKTAKGFSFHATLLSDNSQCTT